MSAAAGNAVLDREARRTARRWQTFALRVGFTAAMMGFVLLSIELVTAIADVADLAGYGRGLFIACAVVQMGLAMVLTPLVVARAIIEERDDRTLELLVLTRLTSREVLGGKIASRLLLAGSIVLGAMPVMALVVTMGGVGVQEAVAVTLGSLSVVILHGTLAGLFALLTRSPLLAAAASWSFTVPAYLGLPLAYFLLTMDYRGLAHVSPLFAAISWDWGGVLPILLYLPPVLLVLRLGAPLFSLTAAEADVRRLYAGSFWNIRGWLTQIGVVLVSAAIVLPVAGGLSWFANIAGYSGSGGWATTALRVVAQGLVWVWLAGLLHVSTWAFLRIAVDFVMVIDGVVSPAPRARGTRASESIVIWRNPVAWREIRPQGWSRLALPGLFLWLCGLALVLATGVWLIPGGLAVLGLGNAALGLVLAVWLAVSSIADERRDGSLELLLVTTQPPRRIVLGKLGGALLPTLPFLIAALPLLLFGTTYVEWVVGDGFFLGGARALMQCVWLLPLWVAVPAAAMVVALRVRRPRAAHGTAVTLLVAGLVLPAVAAQVFHGIPLLQQPALLLVPVFSRDASWYHYLVSTLALTAAAVALLVVLTARLRTWVVAHA